MLPTLRGENGNPGDFEMWLSEVDDGVAAVNWLQRQRFVNPKRIYAFGHSAGGVISSMLSLIKDVPIRHSGSCGGLYNAGHFFLLKDRVPFDLNDPVERELRVLPGNIRWMQRPHFAYYGNKDNNVVRAVNSVRKEIDGQPQPLLHLQEVPGSHLDSLPPAIQEYISVIKADD